MNNCFYSLCFFKLKTSASEKHLWEQEQVIRRENLLKQCSSFGLGANITEDWLDKYKKSLNHILVSDKHKALYCPIPKAASTNWKQVFLVMNGNTTHDGVKRYTLHQIHFTEIPKLSRYSAKGILHRLQTYTTFLVVRNPFTRMLSTYREKFETDKSLTSRGHRNKFGNLIHVKYGNHPELKRKEPPSFGYNVTFQEYIKFIGDRDIRFVDTHWTPMVDFCLPCTVRYDIISHLETLEIDTANILEQLRASEYMDLVVGQSPHGTNSSQRKILSKYYDQLTEDDVEGIRWRYKWDFKVFGYSEKIPVN